MFIDIATTRWCHKDKPIGVVNLQLLHLLAVDEGLICHQAAVKAALLAVAPDLGADGLCKAKVLGCC